MERIWKKLGETLVSRLSLEEWEKKKIIKMKSRSQHYKQPYVQDLLKEFKNGLSEQALTKLARDVGFLEPEPLPAFKLGKRIRKFSFAGPCLDFYGQVADETPLYFINEDGKKFFKENYHIEPCTSCTDHPQTNYPEGYMN